MAVVLFINGNDCILIINCCWCYIVFYYEREELCCVVVIVICYCVVEVIVINRNVRDYMVWSILFDDLYYYGICFCID